MDLRKLKKLIDLVEESGIAEIEVTEGEEKVRITDHSPLAAANSGCARPERSAEIQLTERPYSVYSWISFVLHYLY